MGILEVMRKGTARWEDQLVNRVLRHHKRRDQEEGLCHEPFKM